MPGIDDRLRRDLERAARPAAPDAGRLLDDVARRRARRSTVRRVQAGVVAFAVAAAVFGTFAVLQMRASTGSTPGESVAPVVTATAPALHLGFPTCDVSSMPITVDGVQGFAYVAQKASDAGCPKHGDFVVVAVDVDGDGQADTSYGPLADCYLSCEAFAAPDLNGDGNSEIAVSTAGADGYGVYLFVVTGGTNPSIDPIHVSDPHGIGTIATDPLQLAWIDVVTHFSGAHCGALADGTRSLIVDIGDKLGTNADVTSTTLVLRGTTATVLDATHTTMPLADAPVPKGQLCGAPILGSAGGFPGPAAGSTSLTP